MEFKNWRMVLAAAVLSLFINGLAIANTVPPTQTTHFYGDADGDLTISGLDLIQHKNFVATKEYSYDTLQPVGTSSDWNTCDVDSDRSCSGLDLIILRNVVAGNTNTVTDDNWVISNPVVGGLPATVATSSATPFRINVSSFTGTSGRSGVTVVATIVSGGGTLGGRTCSPIPAEGRDQVPVGGDSCAMSVTQTDWTTSTADGLTETGATGFTFNAPSTSGTTNIKFLVNGNPALDMPTVSITLSVNTVTSDTVALTCPASANENASFQCSISGSGPSGCSVGPATTCAGAAITGCTTVDVTAQGEAAGPGSCLVQVVKGAVSDNKTVTIAEINSNPIITSSCSTVLDKCAGGTYQCVLSATDGDIPAQAIVWAKSGADSCAGLLNDHGDGTADYSFSYPMGPLTCTVGTVVSDSFAPPANDTQNTIVTTGGTTCLPYWVSLPADQIVPVGAVFSSVNGQAADADTDTETLACSLSADTCSFPISVSGSGVGTVGCLVSFTAGPSSEICSATLNVTDGTNNLTDSFNITVSGEIYYVDINAPGAQTGADWYNAFIHPQDAISFAPPGRQILVADGVYVGTGAAADPVLTLADNTTIYGGYAGYGAPDPNARDPLIYQTVLDGQLTSEHVVIGASNAVLDGLIVKRGAGAQGAGIYSVAVTNMIVENCNITQNYAEYGGGIYAANSSMTIIASEINTNSAWWEEWINPFDPSLCVALDCYADFGYGGGIYSDNSTLTLDGSYLGGNYSGGEGGAISALSSSLTINNCDLTGNDALGYHPDPTYPWKYSWLGYGGAIDIQGGSLNVSRSSFDSNETTYGGGIYNWGSTTINVSDTIFINNIAKSFSLFFGNHDLGSGGGIRTNGTSTTIVNSIFAYNNSVYGGGIDGSGGNPEIVKNCTFYGNTAFGYDVDVPIGSGETLYGGNFAVTNSILWGTQDIAGSTVTYSDTSLAGTGNIFADPNFVNPDTPPYNFRLQSDSQCIDSGTAAGAPPADIVGNPRPYGPGVDMGAYEFVGTYLCEDGLDNDGDTLADWPSDPGCASAFDNSEKGSLACDDGSDNDSDGVTDFPTDPGCANVYDTSEFGTNECDDGIDNDGDTIIDFFDPGCLANLAGLSETEQCGDGLDNDGDTATDWPADPECFGPFDIGEAALTTCDYFTSMNTIGTTPSLCGTISTTDPIFPGQGHLDNYLWAGTTGSHFEILNAFGVYGSLSLYETTGGICVEQAQGQPWYFGQEMMPFWISPYKTYDVVVTGASTSDLGDYCLQQIEYGNTDYCGDWSCDPWEDSITCPMDCYAY